MPRLLSWSTSWSTPRRALLLGAGALLLRASAAHAAVPADYKGKPFDPAIAGGPTVVPPSVKAGPYAIPGRLDFANYDMGGDGVAYHADAHYTTKDGDGYRIDRPAATMCKTLNSKPDLFYGTGTVGTAPGQDGSFYPSATTNDFYIGSVHPNDWLNYTVDVKTAGTYTLSSVFSTGNGPPGGEGGDGDMELIVSVNGTKVADWKTKFPDYQNKANYHNWKPYPNWATITLEAGLQVIKFQMPFKHLNMDYVQFDLMGGGAAGSGGNGAAGTGATSTGTAGTGATSAGTAGTGATGTAGTGGLTTGDAGTGGGAAGTTGAAGATATTGGAGTGATGAAGTGGGAGSGVPGEDGGGGCGCAAGGPAGAGGLSLAMMLVAAAFTRGRRRARR